MRRHLGIAVVLVSQVGILVSMPFRAVRARVAGTEIALETEPVDPFDPLSGYYVTLAYVAERPAVDTIAFHLHEPLWVTVARAEPAWTPVSVTRERPAPHPDRVSILGRWDGWRARIGDASRFFIPEDRRTEIEDLLDASGRRGLVDLRVGKDGTPALLRMRVGGRSFGR
ncbi:MAG: GDYXXLXY domain-containing protein [Planctomycetes bacterium]|nr:GDYXXLXY domain-containing protein [Planctomycetota bacterium]